MSTCNRQNLLWGDLILQLREDYMEMFNQLSFNIWGENSGRVTA